MSEEKKEARLIPIREGGEVAPSDSKQLMTFLVELLKSNSLPQWYKNEHQVLAAWNFLASLGLPPQPNLKNVALINGTPCLFNDAPKALAERTGELEICRVFVCNAKYDKICFENKNLTDAAFAGVCQIKRKTRELVSYHFTLDDAKKAGLLNRQGPWTQYQSIMLMRRAQSHALKFEFSDALSGIQIAEYDFNEAPDLKDVTPETKGEDLNNIYGGNNEQGINNATSTGEQSVDGLHSETTEVGPGGEIESFENFEAGKDSKESQG